MKNHFFHAYQPREGTFDECSPQCSAVHSHFFVRTSNCSISSNFGNKFFKLGTCHILIWVSQFDFRVTSKHVFCFLQITTCIHNLFSSGSDRWADLYGECLVKCETNEEITMTCKLEFLKASGYWTSGKKHEVVGTINNSKGKKNIFFLLEADHSQNCGVPLFFPTDSHL